MPAYCWAPLREHLAEMAGGRLRESGRRQAGEIRFRLKAKHHHFGAVFTRKKIVVRPCG
jgi:hypothetical protein